MQKRRRKENFFKKMKEKILTLNLLQVSRRGRNVIFIKPLPLPIFSPIIQFGEAEKWWAMGENRWVPSFSLLQNHSNKTPFPLKISSMFSLPFSILPIFTSTKHRPKGWKDIISFEIQLLLNLNGEGVCVCNLLIKINK